METMIRGPGNASKAEEWALVLTAAGIPHRLEHGAAGWNVLVPATEAPRAHAALDEYDLEAHGGTEAASSEPTTRFTSAFIGVAVAASLLGFFVVTGPPDADTRWFELGAASAERIVGGEPWRAVTALTLHLDAVHVAGNAVATVVLLAAVVQRLGPGLGLWLTLVAGASANLLAAIVQDAHHSAVGASTATFGAIGILAGLRLFPTSRATRTRSRPWVVLATAVILLAMLGTGRGSDVLGHAFGLLCGGVLGLGAGVMLHRPLSAAIQWVLVGMAVLAVVGCWFLAFTGPST
jgi:rhomboid protease GluP